MYTIKLIFNYVQVLQAPQTWRKQSHSCGPYFIQLGIAQYSIRVVGTLSTFERKNDEDTRKTAAQSSNYVQVLQATQTWRKRSHMTHKWDLQENAVVIGSKWKNQPHFLWREFCLTWFFFRTILFCSLSTFEGKNEWWKDMKGIWHPKDQSVPPLGLFMTGDRHHPGYG